MTKEDLIKEEQIQTLTETCPTCGGGLYASYITPWPSDSAGAWHVECWDCDHVFHDSYSDLKKLEEYFSIIKSEVPAS